MVPATELAWSWPVDNPGRVGASEKGIHKHVFSEAWEWPFTEPLHRARVMRDPVLNFPMPETSGEEVIFY